MNKNEALLMLNNKVKTPNLIKHCLACEVAMRELAKYFKEQKDEQIIIVSQGTVGNELSKLALNLSNAQNFDYKIVYKLHPGEYGRWKVEYPWLHKAANEFVNHND